jgi:ABC-type antimicrobial peptide transport system permease subunit
MRNGALIILSSLIAILAFFVVFVFVGLKVLDLFTMKFGAPGDSSSGDTAGWAFVFSLPIFIPIDFIISAIAGFIAGRFSYNKLRRSDKMKINLVV